MFKLYICDDNLDYTGLIRQLIHNISIYSNHTFNIEYCMSSPEKFINTIKFSPSLFNIYILDIEFRTNITGLDLAKHIRNHDPLGHIIFLTNFPNYLPKTFEYHVSPIAYITKHPTCQLESEFKSVFTSIHTQIKAHKEENKGSKLFHFQIHSKKYTIKIDNIVYIEYLGNHKISVNTLQENFIYYGTMKKINHDYPELLQIHQAYLINRNYINSVDFSKKIIRLINDIDCPIGYTYLSKIRKFYSKD